MAKNDWWWLETFGPGGRRPLNTDNVPWWMRPLPPRVLNGGGAAAPATFPTELLTELILALNMDETGGTRWDATAGHNDALEYSIVPSDTGIVSNAAKSPAWLGNYLYVPYVADLRLGDNDWEMSLWIYPTAVTGYPTVINQTTWLLNFDTDSKHFIFGVAGAAATSTVTITANAWYNVRFWYDKTADNVGISVNGEDPVVATKAGGITDSSNQLAIGTAADPAWNNTRFDRIYRWNRVLSTAERTADYMSGAPLQCDDQFTKVVKNIYCYGDSKTGGFTNDGWYGYPPHLSTNVHRYNENPARNAVAGTNVDARYITIDAELAAVAGGPPDYILCSLGTNDLGPIDTTEANFKTKYGYIVDAMHTKWAAAKIGLMRVWKTGDTMANANILDGWIDAIVAARPTYCFAGPDERIFLENGDNGATYLLDGTHPNYLGYLLTAVQWRTLIEAL